MSRSLPDTLCRRIFNAGLISTFQFHMLPISNRSPSTTLRRAQVCTAGNGERLRHGQTRVRVGRNRHNELPSRSEYPAHLSNNCGVVLDVLEHVERHDEVERVLPDRQLCGIGLHRRQPPSATDRRPCLAVVKGEGVPAVVSQYLGVAPAGGTDVERFPRGSEILQELCQNSTTLPIPPVAALDAASFSISSFST